MLGELAKGNRRLWMLFLGQDFLVVRNEQIFFYHQLIQEFMAAIAMREKWVRFNTHNLLCNKKWSEVIILWYDIDKKANIAAKLLQSLRQRNIPWIRPFSRPMSVALVYAIISYVFAFIGVNIIIDLLTKNYFVISKLEANPVESVLLIQSFSLYL